MKNSIQIWKHNTSGESYVVELDKNGTVVKAQGPLHYSDVETFRAEGVIDNQPEDVEWIAENEEQFSLA